MSQAGRDEGLKEGSEGVNEGGAGGLKWYLGGVVVRLVTDGCGMRYRHGSCLSE